MGSQQGEHVGEQVARAIEARRIELGLTVGEFVARSGMSAPALKPLRAGVERGYSDSTKFGVAVALAWPRDAIDRLFAGDLPDETWDQRSVGGGVDGASVAEAIALDPRLDEVTRPIVLAAYDAAVQAGSNRRRRNR